LWLIEVDDAISMRFTKQKWLEKCMDIALSLEKYHPTTPGTLTPLLSDTGFFYLTTVIKHS
jgi:hypothetical protein